LEPEEVLELIHTAPERYDGVRAALRYRADGATKREIRQRLLRSEVARREFGISPEEASEPIRHLEPDGLFGWRCRAWYAGAYRERLETEVPGGGVNISAINGYMRFWRHRVGAREKTTRRGSTWRSTTTGPSMPCSRTRFAASPTSSSG
jgi:hypothetical protein